MRSTKGTDAFLNFAMATLVACAVTMTALVIHRELADRKPKSDSASRVVDWRRVSRDGLRIGPSDAKVTIVEFSDFQCPYCAMLAKQLHGIRREYPRDVAVVYRYFPLASHQFAIPAIRASECAASQGRFEAFHDALFDHQDSLGRVPWEHFATLAEIPDLDAFRTCIAAASPIPALDRDTVTGHALGVIGTPTILINGIVLRGVPPADTLHAYVARELRPRG